MAIKISSGWQISRWLIRALCLFWLFPVLGSVVYTQVKFDSLAGKLFSTDQCRDCCLKACFLCSGFSQQSQSKEGRVYYAESWKKGTRKIEEQKLTIKLDKKRDRFERRIKDASGTDSYKLVIERHSMSTGPSFWIVELLQLKEKIALLIASRGGGDVIEKENYYGSLYPVEDPDWRKTGYLGVPLSAKRVFKVEGFYCIIQVKDYKLNPEKWRVLDSIEIEVEFTNHYQSPNTRALSVVHPGVY